MKRQTKPTKWQNICERVNLAGVAYSDYQRLSPRVLVPGLILKLVGETSNSFDRFAIRVEYAGYSLGYIPAKSIHQSELWNNHRRGAKCIAVLTAFNKTNPTWSMVTIQLKRTLPKVVRQVRSEVEL